MRTETDLSIVDVVSEICDIFDGRDPLAEAHAAMKEMDKDELIGLVLVAANRIGTIIKGEEYEDGLDATVHICYGVDQVFQSYYNALIDSQATVSETGTA
jgi:hypothetical protein